MLIVAVKMHIKPEFKQQCLENFQELSQDVADEKGFIEYNMYIDPKDENQLFLFEKWESQELLDSHLATEHMQEYFKVSENWFVDKSFEVFEVK